MKKSLAKLSLKTDRIISLSKTQTKGVLAGRPPMCSNPSMSCRLSATC
ncbi:MAG: class I lanthipeptide [Spirosomataceae bacterium]